MTMGEFYAGLWFKEIIKKNACLRLDYSRGLSLETSKSCLLPR